MGLQMRLILLCALFCGCANPFGSKGDSAIQGVWGAEDVTVLLQTIAFLDQGRYFENDVQVGVYYVLDARGGASGAENLVFTDYRVRIEYQDGRRCVVSVWTLGHTELEIRISHVSGEGGPWGTYYRLHSGEGL